MKRKYHLPLPQITTHPNPDIGTYLIPGKTVSGLHTQPEPFPLCPLSDKHSPRFAVHLYTIQLCPVARHISRIKAIFVDFLRNRQIHCIPDCIARYRDGNNERERIYNAFINRNGNCTPDRINTICNDRISDHFTRYAFHPCRAEYDKQDKNDYDNVRQRFHGRMITGFIKLENSFRTSKHGQALIYSNGSTSPLSFKSGDVSRCPSTSIIG